MPLLVCRDDRASDSGGRLTAGRAGKDIVLVLAGNKADLERSRQVTLAEAEAYAASIGATLFSTSAKTNKGVDQAFQAIAESASVVASSHKLGA